MHKARRGSEPLLHPSVASFFFKSAMSSDPAFPVLGPNSGNLDTNIDPIERRGLGME